MKEVFYMPKYS